MLIHKILTGALKNRFFKFKNPGKYTNIMKDAVTNMILKILDNYKFLKMHKRIIQGFFIH